MATTKRRKNPARPARKVAAVPIPDEVRRDMKDGAKVELLSKPLARGAVHVLLVARPNELVTEAHADQLWAEQTQALEEFAATMRGIEIEGNKN